MRFFPGCLLLMLLVCSLSPVYGVLEFPYARFRCQCTRVTRRMPRLNSIKRIKTFPPGNGCPRLEILAWLKNKTTVCLDPKDPETLNLLEKIQKAREAVRKPVTSQRK
ncbi:C-X-C motif chemokine 13 [Sturnira hondurensis]|uniref:C-X-C motif chemokine 13 n=1 Tax=Sturnira hondurensis TaxID=192404 RepID=UPI00187AB034|nr:C-X-C motif chemokine 13 [Sturnira hondurensis]